ncbi:MAG: histidine phosphatase family protein [Actinomycetota bacterium]|nr:histidine phosphatase family protein [Actinomycetota bacterium]
MGQILLVRHGQASFGAEDYDVLSEAGWAQARRLGEWLQAQGIVATALVRGELKRHRDTALGIAEGAGWSGLDAAVDAGWDEFDHHGLMRSVPPLPPDHTRREFQAAFEQATGAWAAGAPGDYAETFTGFVARVRGALERAAALAGSGETAVVVSSGGPIAVTCADLVDPDADQAGLARAWARFNTVTVNSSVTRVLVGPTGARLLTFNEHSHLEADALSYR